MKRNLKQDLKLYNLIVGGIWTWLTTAALGFIIGYLIDKNSNRDDHLYLIILGITFIFLGMVGFFLAIFKGLKKIESSEKKEEHENRE